MDIFFKYMYILSVYREYIPFQYPFEVVQVVS